MLKRIIPVFLFLACLLSACAGEKAVAESTHVLWQPQPAASTVTEPAPPVAPTVETVQSTEPELYCDDIYEYAICPMEYFSITQTSGEGTHKNNYAIDFAGEDGSIEDFFAPFTLSIVRIQPGYNIVWAQSTEKVHLANGGLDYVTFLVQHCNNIDGLYEGQIIPQGKVFYAEGTAGNATGNHVHCEFSIGRFTEQGSHHGPDGRVAINGGVPANEVFFLTADTRQNSGETNTGGYAWKTLPVTRQALSDGWHCGEEGHLPDSYTVVREASCTQTGLYRYTCLVCGLSLSTESPALGHTPQQQTVYSAPRYVQSVTQYRCTVCDAAWCELAWCEPFSMTFPDVAQDDAAYAEICDAVNRKLLSTTQDGQFRPDAYLSRVELLTLLYQRLSPSGSYRCDFMDVKRSDVFYPVVAWAVTMGYASASEEDRFAPTCAVTRLAAIQMLLHYADAKGLKCASFDYSSPEAFVASTGLYAASDDLHCVMTRREAARLWSVVMSLAAIK